MKKLALAVILVIAALMFSGCGVQIKQDGNKIFTDADKDLVYKFAITALEKEKYTIKERNRADGIINTVPNKDNPVFASIKDSPKLNVKISERVKHNDVMVEIQALISGDVDEKKSTEVARRAVDRMIEELNKYGKFTAAAEGSATVPSTDQAGFLSYLENALKAKGYSVARTEAAIDGQEAASSSEYNDPMKVNAVITPQGNQLGVAVKASIDGNYDRIGNEQKANQALAELTAIVNEYPVVEQSIQHTYSFVNPKAAYSWAKASLDTLGYLVEAEDAEALTITAKKDNFNILITAADAGDNKSVVSVTARGEGGDSKATLEAAAQSMLAAIKAELALYQVEKTDSKIFANVPMDKALGYGKAALVGTGYKVVKEDKGAYLVAGAKTTRSIMTVCMVNSMGDQGVAIQVTTYVNGNKMTTDEAGVVAGDEVAKIIKYLARYDKVISAK